LPVRASSSSLSSPLRPFSRYCFFFFYFFCRFFCLFFFVFSFILFLIDVPLNSETY
jgi:hypothetical protein